MSEKPLASVVLIFLDAERFLEESIRSVLDQTWPRWELLLVDDGSTDGSTAIARRYDSRHPRVRYLEHDGHANRGMSASRNLGIRHAAGKYVAFLDADDVYLPDKLERQVEILERYPRAGMVYGKTEYWHSWTGAPEDVAGDRVQQHGIPGEVLLDPPEVLTQFLAGRAAVPCSCGLLARTRVVRRIGGFEESFRGMYEDQVFYAKMCLDSPVFVSDDCLERYRQHPDSTCAESARSGDLLLWRRRFLEWLGGYLASRGKDDADLWDALVRETWLAREIGGPASRFRAGVRWLDKWRLRLESVVFPATIRRRRWRRRVPGLVGPAGTRQSDSS